jgi:hypothetical protein
VFYKFISATWEVTFLSSKPSLFQRHCKNNLNQAATINRKKHVIGLLVVMAIYPKPFPPVAFDVWLDFCFVSSGMHE